jgi:acetyltransferase-like isoleucine patch superfamily enzyme
MISGNRLNSMVVGNETFIGRALVAAHDAVIIGNYVCINDGAQLLTGSHDLSDTSWGSYSRPIVINDYAWIATSAIILPGVTIGKGAVVGAGAVVSRDVPDFAVVAGNPAQILQKRRIEHLDYSPVHFLAIYTAWYGKPRQNYASH